MTAKEGQIADWDTFIDRFIAEEITRGTPNPPKANFYKRGMVYMTQLFIHRSDPHQKGIIHFMRWIEKINSRESTTKPMAPLKSQNTSKRNLLEGESAFAVFSTTMLSSPEPDLYQH